MKIKNIQMVAFVNGFEELSRKNLPSRLYYALSCNMKSLSAFIQPYQEAYEKAKEAGQEEVNALINQEIDAGLQTVPASILDVLDSGDKFDVLTAAEIEAIMFMIE